jgi:hypothetical protein
VLAVLETMGLSPVMDRCSPFRDGLGAGELELCHLAKIPRAPLAR